MISSAWSPKKKAVKKLQRLYTGAWLCFCASAVLLRSSREGVVDLGALQNRGFRQVARQEQLGHL